GAVGSAMVSICARSPIHPFARAGSREDRPRVDARARSIGRTRGLVHVLARGPRMPCCRDPSSRAGRTGGLAPDPVQGPDERPRVVPHWPLPRSRPARGRRLPRRLQPFLQPSVRILAALQLPGATTGKSTRGRHSRRGDDTRAFMPGGLMVTVNAKNREAEAERTLRERNAREVTTNRIGATGKVGEET